MNGYRYRVWCPDCCGEDSQGCFDGNSELSEEVYPTVGAAAEAGAIRTINTIWDFSVEEDGSTPPDWLYPYAAPRP